ncbi:adenylate kinase [Kordia algicida OT-1]|uniref:Adenylate kinase n=1 Tax=Kordia algicida OT-1 TaxID=391587 RepID=A9DML4_9FLAO|nr:adenylate kinase [Kordia algicida]EDP97735.1 adenylate kinase [Kordia algicida OT-1]
MIKLHDKYFKKFISETQIQEAVANMAAEMAEDLKEDRPIFIGILNGVFMFFSDFMKAYPYTCEMSFIKLASYHGTTSSGDIKELIGLSQDIEGRTVVVLEDIIDTGNTLDELHKIFKAKKVKQFKIGTLFFKPEAYTKQHKIDYIGMEIPNEFIVGYGLDYDELGRNLPEVYQLHTHNMINLILFGKPGAGKGTQANFLKEKYDLVHISTGDVFRYNMKNDTELGKLAKSYIDKGDLVPDEVTINMLQAEVEKKPEAKGFIFDGFPRTTAQAEALDNFLASKDMGISATIALEADDEILIQRLLERGKVSGRADDQDEDKIRNRFDEYNQKTAPLIDFYKKQNKFHSVNGIGTIDEITVRLSNVIDEL